MARLNPGESGPRVSAVSELKIRALVYNVVVKMGVLYPYLHVLHTWTSSSVTKD